MYKQKLIDLLKSDKEIKMKMEKLEFWCKVYNEQTNTFWLVTWADWNETYKKIYESLYNLNK